MTSKAALARASQLAVRARELRRAQADVQELTLREVETLARTAAGFFDILPYTLFSNALVPLTARGARRVRHRILHRVLETTERSVVLRVILLGRDGQLRVFTARASTNADLMAALDPTRLEPTSVLREIEEWTPAVRVADFRPLEVLDQLSRALDAVEATITRAETKVHAQKDALQRGDLGALRRSRANDVAASPAALVPSPPNGAPAPVPASTSSSVSASASVPASAPASVPAPESALTKDLAMREVRSAGTPARGLFPVLPPEPPPLQNNART